MEIVLYILVGVAGLVALWFVLKFVGGCLVRILVGLAIVAVAALVIWLLATRLL
jgi:hypothetical protein